MAAGAEDLFAALQWVGMFKAVGKADASTSLATSQHRTPPQLAPMTYSHILFRPSIWPKIKFPAYMASQYPGRFLHSPQLSQWL